MRTERATMAQALVRFLAAQKVERDGVAQPFFAGMWGIFGHGNVTGLGQALEQMTEVLPLLSTRRTSRRWCTRRSPTPR